MKNTAAESPSDRIVRTATRHFAEKGLAGARMDEIAEDAEVNKATIYYHIGDKAELYAEVMRTNLQLISESVIENVSLAIEPEQKLQAYIATMADNVQQYPCIAPLIMRELASGAKNIPLDALGYLTKMLMSLMQLLEQGRKQGVFRQTNAGMTHLMIIGSIMFYMAGEPIRSQLVSMLDEEQSKQIINSDHELIPELTELLMHAVKA